MPQTLDEKMEEEKERDRKARAMGAIEDLRDAGVNPFGSGEQKPSGFERSTVDVIGAMDKPASAALTELHSKIPEKVLSSVYEMHSIYKSAVREQRMLKRDKTVSPNQLAMNDAYIQVMREMVEHIDRELAAVDGFRSMQAVQMVGSLVQGEQMKNASMMPGLFPPMQDRGFWGRLSDKVSGKKR